MKNETRLTFSCHLFVDLMVDDRVEVYVHRFTASSVDEAKVYDPGYGRMKRKSPIRFSMLHQNSSPVRSGNLNSRF